MSHKTVLLLGATGYIGGTVLYRLLSLKRVPKPLEITILVRSAEKTELFNAIPDYNNLTAVTGSLSDQELLVDLASKSDFVINCADADNLEATKAILAGLKKRYETTGEKPALIHTSGTGVLSDDAQGMFATETVYLDIHPEQLETLPTTAPHRIVDLTIVDAYKEGYLRTYIILPATIYGIVSTPFTHLELQNNHSQQIPALIRASLARGQGGMIGEGKNMWGNVSIYDVVDLYALLFLTVLRISGPPRPGEGRFGFYFAASGEHDLLSVSTIISEALVEIGKGESKEPTSFTEEEIKEYFGGSTSLGSNSRCRAERSRRLLGWRPNYGTEDMWSSIGPEIEAYLNGYEAQVNEGEEEKWQITY